jgi:cobalt-zinc-cadmium efflux system outer membrane protein
VKHRVGTSGRLLAVGVMLAVPAAYAGQDSPPAASREPAAVAAEAPAPAPPADRVRDALGPDVLKALVSEALKRNPALAAVAAEARAAREVPAQAGALPDPVLGGTGYLAPPETRVGPQRFMLTLSQRLPWFGKVGLRETAARHRADALESRWQAHRLSLVTQVRRLAHEIAFLDEHARIVREDERTLEHFEQLARARYASGYGLEQGVIKIQAEITKDENRLLDIADRRAALAAALNAVRDRPQDAALPVLPLPRYGEVAVDPGQLRVKALALRPEMARSDAQIAEADTRLELARKDYKPDFTVGVTYGFVGPRADPAGLLSPPPDNADDVFGIRASVNLPIKRGKLRAGVREAAEGRTAATERKRDIVTAIDADLGELVERVRLTWDQIHLLESVLLVQAEQSLRSVESGYSAGTLNSLDLLDAERLLLEVRTAIARARADYATSLARLEGAVGESLRAPLETGGPP